MKKFFALALTVLLVMSTMPMTAFAGFSTTEDFGFTGFKVVEDSEGKGVVVDLEKQIVYGFSTLLQVERLGEYLEKGENIRDMYVCQNYGTSNEDKLGDKDFIGTGATIVLETKDGAKYPFDVVVFGDVNGDSACDVLDTLLLANVSANKEHFEENEAAKFAAKDPDTLDEEVTEEDYQAIVNSVVSEEVEQNKSENANVVTDAVVEDQIYTGSEIKPDEDIVITFNEGVLSSEHYKVVDYDFNVDCTTGERKAIVTIEGTGLFSGKRVIEFEIVGILQDIVNEVNDVIKEAALDEVVEVVYTPNGEKADVDIVVNASKFIRGDFNANMSAFSGLLARIDEYRAEKLENVDCTVDEFAIANNGAFSRAALKKFVFDLASGMFCDVAFAESNTIKSYAGSISVVDGVDEAFNVNLKVEEDFSGDINRVKTFAAKISRYVGFDVVNGNAVINVSMPAAFSKKVVDVLSGGSGDVEKATNAFNNLFVYEAFEDYLAEVTAEQISASAADEINQAINVASMLGEFVNKGLDEISEATVTSNKGTMPLLSGLDFAIDEKNPNKFGALVMALAFTLSQPLHESRVGDFYKDGIYTLTADVTLDYKNIKETVIVNLDLFGAVETPDVIEKTVVYFDSIINDLGVSNVASVSYDKEALRGLVSFDASQILDGNLKVNESAIDGLYTDIMGYFDDNYGTSTIIVDGKQIVTSGKINKSALKGYIFDFVSGFFNDMADLNSANIFRSSTVKVVEKDGTVHSFDLDFKLDGKSEDINKVKSISAKVANCVTLDTSSGNAEVTVSLPAAMKRKIVTLLGDGDVETAKANINNLEAGVLIQDYIMKLEPSDISTASAEEIQTVINMIADMDGIINKVMGQVSDSSVAYDAKGNKFALLSGNDFVVADKTMSSVVLAGASLFSQGLLENDMANFMNEDGTYTIKCDIALNKGGIKETVILNFDIFDVKENDSAIKETVSYVDSIVEDLGIANVVDVKFADGKAVASLDASEILSGNVLVKEEALDGLYTKVKDYFDAKFGDSTITVGKFMIVENGAINKTALKNFVFDFAAGFFSDVAKMDDGIIESYATTVVDAEGNIEEFVFDFELAGAAEDVKTIQNISAKVAECVTLDTSSGNAEVTVSLPAAMKRKIVTLLGDGDVETAKANINNLEAGVLIQDYIMKLEPSDISTASAEEIQTVINMIADMDGIINKVMGQVSDSSVAYDAKGNKFALLSGNDFVVADKTMSSVVLAGASLFSQGLLENDMANFMNEDGTYTIKCDIALNKGGIKETVVLNFNIF